MILTDFYHYRNRAKNNGEAKVVKLS